MVYQALNPEATVLLNSTGKLNFEATKVAGTRQREKAFLWLTQIAPFLYATETGEVETLIRKISEGTDINCRNSIGITPLIIAAGRGHKSVVNLLLENNANIDATGSAGQTAIMEASRHGYKDIVEDLIQHGANLTQKEKWGRDCLTFAAWQGHFDIVRVLLEYANNNNITLDIKNALEKSRANNFMAIVELLEK